MATDSTTRFRPPRRHALALGCATALAAAASHAQTPVADPAPSQTTLPRVTIAAPNTPVAAGVTGLGERPLEDLPLQATVIEREQIEAAGARRLADLTKLDASVTDAYNSPGYWDFLAVRGYTLDQRYNYRREGLPISAETAIPLDNKQRVEILKGTSGIQAGTSAPGGLVNYVVKRPQARAIRSATVTTGERGSVGLALDLGDRAGPDQRLGWRLNAAHEDRDPEIDAYGRARRSVLALSGELRLAGDTLLAAEVEWSRQKGASLPGDSLLGDRLPGARAPFNLNNQPWSLPNVFDGLTGTLRLEQPLAAGWRWTAQLGTQRLETDDRLAFPFGCYDNDGGTPDDPNDDLYYADRYCPDGRFDLYDFRSENERRRTHALQTALSGDLVTAGVTHALNLGVLASRRNDDFESQAFQFVGQGHIDGSVQTPPNPVPNDEGTDRTERTLEFFASDAIAWGGGWTTWLGARHTRLDRDSVRSDGSRRTAYGQSLTTPWAAVSWSWQPRHQVYASWGRGAESAVVPNREGYPNAGEALPALKSRQWEVGLKAASGRNAWSLAWFDIDRPAITDTGTRFARDGSARHRGVEATFAHESGPWLLRGGAVWLDAERQGAEDAGLNGRRPINVPERTLKLHSRYRVAALPGLDVGADLTHEGRRSVLDDGSIELPSWTRADLALRYQQRRGAASLTWRLGIDNVFDRRAWKESPLQFGHVYLFPLEARTWRLSLQAEL